jgi:hypothetical protein
VKRNAGQQREAELELERERADQRHHQQRPGDLRNMRRVPQALAQLAGSPGYQRDLMQAAGVQAEQRGDDEAEAHRVHDEAPSRYRWC